MSSGLLFWGDFIFWLLPYWMVLTVTEKTY